MTKVISLDPKKRIAAPLQPAKLSEVQGAVTLLAKALPIMPSIQDPEAFKGIMAEFLAPYPADVLMEAVYQAIPGFKHMPSIHEMVAICDQLIEPRRKQLLEHRRRQEEKDERQRRCRDFQARLAIALGDDVPSLNEIELAARLTPNLLCAGMPVTWRQFADEDPLACAELCKRLAEIARSEPLDWGEIRHLLATTEKEWAREHRRWRDLERQARERLGDAAPLPGDFALADAISNSLVSRGGSEILWPAALQRGELWAAQYCRLMALAERTRQAIGQGRIGWNECLAIGKLISGDEAAARSEVEKAEAHAARPQYECPPPDSFWDALWRIRKACGLDVPRSKDPDALNVEKAGSAKHLTALAGLADVREILDRQAREEWEAKHPGLIWAAPAEELPERQELTEQAKEQQ
jgi:hypothetical protein